MPSAVVPRLRRQLIDGPLVPALIALVAAVLIARSSSTASHQPSEHRPAPAPATPEVRAWLGGLEVDDEVAGWRVAHVSAVERRKVDVRLTRGDQAFTVSIAKKGALPHSPPMEVDGYALYYGNVAPPGGNLDTAWRPVLKALAKRLQASESAPAGL